MSLTLILVNYNTALVLGKSLKSIQESLKNLHFNIFVVDNFSTERDIEKFPDLFPEVKFIFRNINSGFGSACNFATKWTDSEYLVFANPDTEFTTDVLTPIIDFINQHPGIGACAPMLISEDGKYQSSTGFKMSIFFEILEAFWIIDLYRKLEKSRFMKNKTGRKPVKVAWVSGALLVIKKEVFESINGFDEEFFLNYEDMDLCRRLNNAGYANLYFPFLKAIHTGLASQSKNYEQLVINRYKSRLVYADKYYNIFMKYITRLIHIWGLVFRVSVLFFIPKKNEEKQRYSGYKKSLKMYLGY